MTNIIFADLLFKLCLSSHSEEEKARLIREFFNNYTICITDRNPIREDLKGKNGTEKTSNL